MKPCDTFQASHDGQSIPHHSNPGQSVEARPRHIPDEGATTQSPRHTSQAERAAMHPDHHDLEWRYCRAAWGRLAG